MTITTEDITVTHDCNGTVTDFEFEFKIFAEDDIKVIATDSDGAETELTITTDYTVAGENGAFESGGTVSTVKEVDGVMESYAYADGYTVTILLDLDLKQETDLEYAGTYSSSAIEQMADRLTKIVQQLSERMGRAILFKRSSELSELEIVDPSSGYYLYSDDGESVTWVENVETGTATITDFIKTLLDDANASAALTTLGFSTYIKTLIDDANAYTARKTLKTPLSRVLTTAKTAAYTVTSTDDGMLITVDATAGNIAITLPAVGDLWNGFCIGIKKTDSSSNYVESTPDGSEKIDGASSHILRFENDVSIYVVDGTGWKIVARDSYGFLNENDLTDHGILLGSGTGVVTPSAVMTNGQILVGQSASDPLPKSTSGDVTISTTGVFTIGALKVDTGMINNANVTQGKLKTSQGAVSVQVDHTDNWNWLLLTLPGGEYGFYPQLKTNDVAALSAANIAFEDMTTSVIETTTYTSYIYLGVFKSGSTSGYYTYAQQRYVTSSGEVHWIFILRDKITKQILSMYQAPDHPCFGNGGKPLLTPHPFGSYDETKHEIIVINPSLEEIEQMELETIVDDETKPDKDLLQIITENYEIDEDSNPEWPTKPVTVGLPKYIQCLVSGKRIVADYRFMGKDDVVEPIKKIIPKPDYIKVKSLRKKK